MDIALLHDNTVVYAAIDEDNDDDLTWLDSPSDVEVDQYVQFNMDDDIDLEAPLLKEMLADDPESNELLAGEQKRDASAAQIITCLYPLVTALSSIFVRKK